MSTHVDILRYSLVRSFCMSLPNDVPSSRDVDEALFERGVHRGKTIDGDAVFHQGPVELGNLVFFQMQLDHAVLHRGDKVRGVLLQQFDRTVKRAPGYSGTARGCSAR